MWVAMLKSGVHATLAGVILAMFIPMRSWVKEGYSPLRNIEHDLHAAVAGVVVSGAASDADRLLRIKLPPGGKT